MILTFIFYAVNFIGCAGQSDYDNDDYESSETNFVFYCCCFVNCYYYCSTFLLRLQGAISYITTQNPVENFLGFPVLQFDSLKLIFLIELDFPEVGNMLLIKVVKFSAVQVDGTQTP